MGGATASKNQVRERHQSWVGATSRDHQIRRGSLRVSDRERNRSRRAVLVDGLAGNARNRWRRVRSVDGQEEAVAHDGCSITDGQSDGGISELIRGGQEVHGAVGAAPAQEDVRIGH